MVKILDEIKKQLPRDAEISEIIFEGANIVLYTKNSKFFLEGGPVIKKIVNDIKKRIELRPDPSLSLDLEKTKDMIEKLLPKDAGNTNLIFDPQRARIIIEAEKPGVVIGRQGEFLKEIRSKTNWVPTVRRIPSIRSRLLENIRGVLYENNDYRKKFLHKLGKRIYEGWTRTKREEWIRITPLGAGREVGRSCFLLQTPESKVMLDCGINVASTDNQFPYLEAPEFNIQDLDAVIITHPHIDHVGLVPYLYKMGYRGPVYCTAPTRDIGALLCLDAIGVSEKEGNGATYNSSDVKEFVKHTVCLDYEEVTDITPDIRITLYDAGHNLGSAMAHIHIGNGLHNFLYTGDFNYETSNLLAAAATKFPRLESVMLESTYGSKRAPQTTRKEAEDHLVKVITDTMKRKGKVLMPVLGVGRSQEIMVILDKLVREKKIPKVPVYLQGMVWDVTAIHTAYPDFFNAKMRKQIFQEDYNPFMSEIFSKVSGRKEMKEVIEGAGPYIIMATSGMLTGGASVTYFRELADNPKNSIVLTSYQGPGSIGRRLEDGERDIGFMEGQKQDIVKVLAEVHTIKGFSGHSGYNQIYDWVQNLDPRPKKAIIIHGESRIALELASAIYQNFRMETLAPKDLETIRLR
jgi:uncharacterized protein